MEPLSVRGFLARAFVLGFGVFAVLWAVAVFPSAQRESRLAQVANQILAGKTYKDGDLLVLRPAMAEAEKESLCRPGSLQSAAVIHLRLVERAMETSSQQAAGSALDQLISSVRKSLECAPSDSFLWFVLYWAETARNGVNPSYLDFLRLSYKYGPNEGWIALKRSPYALAVFEQLPAATAGQVVAEFAGLVNSGFHNEAAKILLGASKHIQSRLLQSLASLPERQRVDFANEIHRQGYNLAVPGVAPHEARPWQY